MDASRSDDERELMAYQRTGDRGALERLLRSQADLAFRTAVGVLGSVSDAEDAVQTAFIQILLHADHYRPGGGVRSWIVAIVINACRMQRRAARRRAQHEGAAPMPSEPVPERVDREQLADAMARLEEAFRLPIRLRYLEGMEFRDIAAALKVPEKTARTRVSRGLERLRSMLQAQGGTASLASIAAMLPSGLACPIPNGVGQAAGRIAAMPHREALAQFSALHAAKPGLAISTLILAFTACLLLLLCLSGHAPGHQPPATSRQQATADQPAPRPVAPPPPADLDRKVVVHLFHDQPDTALKEIRLALPEAISLRFAAGLGLPESVSPGNVAINFPNRENRAMTVRSLCDLISHSSGCVWREIDGEAFFLLAQAPGEQPDLKDIFLPPPPPPPRRQPQRTQDTKTWPPPLQELFSLKLIAKHGASAPEADRENLIIPACQSLDGIRDLAVRFLSISKTYREWNRLIDKAAGDMIATEYMYRDCDSLILALDHDPVLTPLLLTDLQNPEFPLRPEAIRLAGAMRLTQAGPILVGLLEDPKLSCAAAQAIGAIGFQAARPALHKIADAAIGQARMPDASGPGRKKPLYPTGPDLGRTALASLAKLGDTSIIPEIIEMDRQNTHVENRTQMTRFYPDPDVLPDLLALPGADADAALARIVTEASDQDLEAIPFGQIQHPEPLLAAACLARIPTSRSLKERGQLLTAMAKSPELLARILAALDAARDLQPKAYDPRSDLPREPVIPVSIIYASPFLDVRDHVILTAIATGIERDGHQLSRRVAAILACTGRVPESACVVKAILQRHPSDEIGADCAFGMVRSRDPELVANGLDADAKEGFSEQDRFDLLQNGWQDGDQYGYDYRVAILHSHASGLIRYGAFLGLMHGRFGYASTTGTDTLVNQLFSDTDPRIRGEAYLSLRDLETSKARPFLLQGLEDPMPFPRQCALSMLDTTGDNLECFEKTLLHDPDWRVRRIALQQLQYVLESIRTEDANDHLRIKEADVICTVLAKDPAPEVRAVAAWALSLEAWLPDQSMARYEQALESASSADPDPQVRSIAQEAATNEQRLRAEKYAQPYSLAPVYPEWTDEPPMSKTSQ